MKNALKAVHHRYCLVVVVVKELSLVAHTGHGGKILKETWFHRLGKGMSLGSTLALFFVHSS
jgi:hypothetical protein